MITFHRRTTQFTSYYHPKVTTLGDNIECDYINNRSINCTKPEEAKSTHNWNKLPYCLAKNPYYNHRRNHTVANSTKCIAQVPRLSEQPRECITRSWFVRKKKIEDKYKSMMHSHNRIGKSNNVTVAPKLTHNCILQLYNRNIPHKQIASKIRNIIFENSFISQRMKESI